MSAAGPGGPRRLPGREERFRRLWRGGPLGARLEWFDAVDSTNRLLRGRAEAGAEAGLVLAAEVQTSGRGQRQNQWASPAGGLWFSSLLRPTMPAHELPGLMPLAGERVANVLRGHALDVRVKHPNDVLTAEGLKLCGILAEAVTHAGEPTPRYVVLGVGLNVANDIPPELEARATSLAKLLPHPPELEELLAELLEALGTL